MAVYVRRNRTDASPKRAAEPDSEFFERIAGPFWDQVRDVINEWWSHLPAQSRPGMRSRLLDRNSGTNVFSALWELYLHEMLIGSGCKVAIEHSVGTTGKNPDFLVSREGERFVVEAIWSAQRLADMGEQIPPPLIDAIDNVPSPNFFLSYSVHAMGAAAPSQKRLKNGLVQWLSSLDPDQVIADCERKVPLPRHTWQEAGWSLSFEAIPRSPGKRDDPAARAIGVYPSISWLDVGSDRVLDAVKKKGSRYGDLGMPFIVAVGQAAFFPESRDVETALYGASVEYVHTGTPVIGRLCNGYWNSTYDHAHGKVSGVLTVDNPAPWTWAKNTPVLWHSSDPASLPAPVLPSWATAQLADAQVERHMSTCPIQDVLGLPQLWPVGDAFP
ncbi:hypothetical protein [Streptomyces rubiginosohelvolus]|uniref:hypothetical protein n=1 Tax=Streptomyces rubiginosohelvolus TaxID=67362 RepID=UPI00386BB975|nr:hypothetical protein OG475_16270 [Streptomyces rubiginosohelvolus]